MQVCSACNENKKNNEFRTLDDNSGFSTVCKECEGEGALPRTIRDPTNPEDAKEIAMKRMLSGAKSRARAKGLMFNLNYADLKVPNLCPILKIPLIPSDGDGMTDNSPSLDKRVPHLGYVKGNVTVISMLANRIKTNATAAQIYAVGVYTDEIEQENS